MDIQNLKSVRITNSALLLAVALVAALFFDGDHIYFLSLSWMTLALMFVYQFAQNREISVKVDLALIVITLFVTWMLLALYWHPVPWQGVLYNWRLGAFFFTLIVARYLSQEDDVSLIVNTLMLVGFVSAALTLYESFFLGQPADGFFVNKNNNAAFLNVFIFPLMSLLLLGQGQWRHNLLKGALLSLLFLGVLEVSSRGAFIAFVIALSFLLIFALYERRYKNIFLVFTILSLTLSVHVLFSEVDLRSHMESHSRWLLWGSAIEMVGDAKWYGIGNGLFYLVYPQYRHPDELSGGYFVHDDYLQILLELGIPGILLIIALMVILAWKVWKLVLEESKHLGGISIYLGMFAAILAVAVHSLVTFNLYLVAILIVLGTYTGLILKRASLNNQSQKWLYTINVTRKKTVVILILVVPFLKSILFTGYADAISDGLLGESPSSSPSTERLQQYQELWDLDSHNYKYPYLMAVSMDKPDESQNAEEREKAFRHAINLLQSSKKLNPYAYEVYIYEAELTSGFKDIVGSGWRDEAIALALKALELNPRLVLLRIRVAEFMESIGLKERALRIMLDGLVYKQNNDRSYYEYGKTLAGAVGSADEVKLFSDLIEEEKVKAKQLLDELIEEYRSKEKKKSVFW